MPNYVAMLDILMLDIETIVKQWREGLPARKAIVKIDNSILIYWKNLHR